MGFQLINDNKTKGIMLTHYPDNSTKGNLNMNKQKAFTLIELLVVISIIGILMGILLPALKAARDQAKKVICVSHMKQLGTCMRLYVDDNNGKTHYAANNGLWDNAWEDPVVLKEYYPYEKNAYWGIPYKSYTSGNKIFGCPSAKRVDDWPESGWGKDYQHFFKYSSYGLNGRLAPSPNRDYVDRNKEEVKQNGTVVIDKDFKWPTELIVFQDHLEQKMDVGDNGSNDCLAIPPDKDINLTQWRGGGTLGDFPYAVDEVFRHSGKVCNTYWWDGHVSGIRRTSGWDVPLYWYTGNRDVKKHL